MMDRVNTIRKDKLFLEQNLREGISKYPHNGRLKEILEDFEKIFEKEKSENADTNKANDDQLPEDLALIIADQVLEKPTEFQLLEQNKAEDVGVGKELAVVSDHQDEGNLALISNAVEMVLESCMIPKRRRSNIQVKEVPVQDIAKDVIEEQGEEKQTDEMKEADSFLNMNYESQSDLKKLKDDETPQKDSKMKGVMNSEEEDQSVKKNVLGKRKVIVSEVLKSPYKDREVDMDTMLQKQEAAIGRWLFVLTGEPL